MCEPISLSTGLLIASTAVSAAGVGIGAISANQQANYQAKVADRNAQLENSRAADALERGRTEDRRYQQQVAQQMGSQRAALAANGLEVDFGSAFDVRADTALAGQEDAQTIRENAIRETRGFEINAANYRSEAVGQRRAASGALVQGAFGIGSTVLGGATQYAKSRAGRK